MMRALLFGVYLRAPVCSNLLILKELPGAFRQQRRCVCFVCKGLHICIYIYIHIYVYIYICNTGFMYCGSSIRSYTIPVSRGCFRSAAVVGAFS